MKTLDDYLNIPYTIQLTSDEEGGYVASYPELSGCITCGDTVENAIQNAKDAKKEWFIAALEQNIKIPEHKTESEYSGQFKLRIPKSLHKALAENSAKEGISMNQYCLYLLSSCLKQSDTQIHL